MTQYTPEQARHIAGCMERGAEMRNMGAPALRSLADQVEALTAENANILRASLYSADLATQAMEDVKELTAERDAIKQQAQIWKMEAETQKATVHEIYQLCTGATGEPGDWHGAEPVRALVADAARWRYLMSENDVDGYITGAGGAYWERGAASREQIEAAIDLLADAAPVVPAPAACAETLIFEDYPEFHAEGMGCGLEDRNITDRYEAMRYGWDEALEAVGLNITGFLSDLPQTAPVAQLSELPKLAFDESHIDYIDRYGGFCRDCADEDGVCPSSGLPCGGSKKAIRHVLTALAYGVNHGYIPVILCAAPTTPKGAA